MTTKPFIALVSDSEVWNPAVHQRRDLLQLTLEFNGFDSRVPTATMTVENPRIRPSELEGRRVLISDRGRLLFDGILETVPLGLVDDTVTLQATSRPPVEDDLLAAMNVLATSLKVAPYWEPLCVPQGKENDWAEILAARTAVIAHSRIQGAPSVCDAIGGSSALTIKPLKGSIKYEPGEKMFSKYGVKLTAEWKQLVSQNFDVRVESKESDSIFSQLETFTPQGIIDNFPKAGTAIGDGFTVTNSECEYVRSSTGEPGVVGAFTAQHVAGSEELDPFILFVVRKRDWRFPKYAIRASLDIEYRWEAERRETAQFSFPVVAQPGSVSDEEYLEELTLRSLTDGESDASWQPFTDYALDEQIVDGRYVYRCRVAHKSGKSRTGAEWILVGETSYLSSRRISSFFRSTRGQAVLAHALERTKAKARFGSRKVRISFEAPMPKPWLITEDMLITLNGGAAPNKLPGGTATGRLVEYRMTWDRGTRLFSGVIECCVGTGSTAAPTMGTLTGRAPSASGRVEVEVENDATAQLVVLEEAQGEEAGIPVFNLAELPETVIRITTTPAAATSFEQTVNVPISGSLGLPLQVPLEV